MKKEEFLEALRAGLAGTADAEQALAFYQEMIDDRMEDGMPEEEAVAQVGPLETVLAQAVQDLTVVAREPQPQIRRVLIQERDFDLVIRPTLNAEYRLVASREGCHDCTLEAGTLRITRNQRPGRDFDEMTLYLPQAAYERLELHTVNGDVRILQDFKTIQLTSASGDVTLSGDFCGDMTLQTASGDLTLRGTFAGETSVQTASGDMDLQGRFSRDVRLKTASGCILASAASFSQALQANTVSGDIELNDVLSGPAVLHSTSGEVTLDRFCGESLTMETVSGDLTLRSTLSKGDFFCKTVSGDCELSAADGPRMRFTSTSGSLSGTLLHSKTFTTRTLSGDMDLPEDGAPNGTFEIRTVSGDADLSIAK